MGRCGPDPSSALKMKSPRRRKIAAGIWRGIVDRAPVPRARPRSKTGSGVRDLFGTQLCTLAHSRGDLQRPSPVNAGKPATYVSARALAMRRSVSRGRSRRKNPTCHWRERGVAKIRAHRRVIPPHFPIAWKVARSESPPVTNAYALCSQSSRCHSREPNAPLRFNATDTTCPRKYVVIRQDGQIVKTRVQDSICLGLLYGPLNRPQSFFKAAPTYPPDKNGTTYAQVVLFLSNMRVASLRPRSGGELHLWMQSSSGSQAE